MSEQKKTTKWQGEDGRITDLGAAEFVAYAEKAPRDEIVRQKKIVRSKLLTHVASANHYDVERREEMVEPLAKHSELMRKLEDNANAIGDLALEYYGDEGDFKASSSYGLHGKYGFSQEDGHQKS